MEQGVASRMGRAPWAVMLVLALQAVACGGGAPGEDGLRGSFAAQLAANPYLGDVSVSPDGDEIAFTGPGAEGGEATWRVRIDTAVVEPYEADPAYTFRGTVVSSWYSDGRLVEPTGDESNLPLELTSNGLAQECWALWNDAAARWEWE